VEGKEWAVRRLGAADRDLAKIVEQINSASMEISEPFTQDSLNGFVADDGISTSQCTPAGSWLRRCTRSFTCILAVQRYVYVDEVDTDEAFRRRGVATAILQMGRGIARVWGHTRFGSVLTPGIRCGLHGSSGDRALRCK
jgi:GNAT superfamily N-acetyltransferase